MPYPAKTWGANWWELFLNLFRPHCPVDVRRATTAPSSPAVINTMTTNIAIHIVAILTIIDIPVNCGRIAPKLGQTILPGITCQADNLGHSSSASGDTLIQYRLHNPVGCDQYDLPPQPTPLDIPSASAPIFSFCTLILPEYTPGGQCVLTPSGALRCSGVYNCAEASQDLQSLQAFSGQLSST